MSSKVTRSFAGGSMHRQRRIVGIDLQFYYGVDRKDVYELRSFEVLYPVIGTRSVDVFVLMTMGDREAKELIE